MSSQQPVYQNYINGAFEAAGEHLEVFNPATGDVLSRVPESRAEDVERALAAARGTQKAWAARPAVERAGYLRKIAARIREDVPRLARIITREQGKVTALAETEVNFTADYLDYMAEWARRIEGEIIESDRPNENIFLFRKPLGVVAGILPWNFPLFLIARKMAPALVTSNTIVIKPSEETPNNCFEFARLLDTVGLPAGVFNVVSGSGATTGNALTASAEVDMISFTGSVATGSRIMAIALANDSDYGLTSSIYTRSLANAMRACREIDYGETYINRENFEAMQGFHAGVRKSGIGGADGKHGLYEYTHSHVVYLEA